MSQHQQLTLPLELQGYTIRESKRAKKLQLSVSPIGNVEVVVPAGTDRGQIPVFIARHEAWIKQSLKRIQQYRGSIPDEALPNRIEFQATQQCWQVGYQMGDHYVGRENRVRESLNKTLCCAQDTDAVVEHLLQLSLKNESDVLPLLRDWLTSKAKQTLIPWIHQVSSETALPFKSVTIRAQKTRWGSCSSRKSINLNRALLFLKPRIVRYVLVHELCHTRHLNHSAAYWDLVRRYEPEYRALDAALNRATYLIPRWAYPQ